MSDNNELVEALLTLLDDDDESIARTAQNKLRDLGTDVIPELEDHIDDQPLNVKIRAREVMNNLQSRDLEQEFRSIPTDDDGKVDLEAGLFTIAKIEYPSLAEEPYVEQLDNIAEQIDEAMGRWEARDAHTTVEIVNNVLFDHLGFEGNSDNYYDPRNSFINQILQRKTGIPISLSVIVLLVAERLDLPYRGVGMPAHFIVSYEGGPKRIFIDAFNRGKKLGKKDCVEFLSRTGFGYVEEYLEPVSNLDILSRFMRNLINVYSKNQSPDRVQELRRYLAILNQRY